MAVRRMGVVERMLRLYFVQQWFNLSDPAVEGAVYDFAGDAPFCRDRSRPRAGARTRPLCRFRHLLKAYDLGRRLFEEVQRHLAANGLQVATSTMVDATIINAPSSTKKREKARDPEMHQTRKGNQWHFGMTAHIGVDSRTKLIHAVVATPANVADSRVLPQLLHARETRVWGDQAYRGQHAVIRQHAPRARDFSNRRYRQRGMVDLAERAKNRTKSKVRARACPGEGGGRAFDRGRQAGLRLCQSALSRAQQEREPAAGDLRPRQSVHRPSATIALSAGII